MSDYLCKDCKHSRISFFDKICSYIFTFKQPNGHFYSCARVSQPSFIADDFVIGKHKVHGKREHCSVARMRTDNEACGPGAKFWIPKKKKDLFKLLTKD